MKVAGQGSGLNLAKEVISARGERERFGSDVVVGTARIPLKPPAVEQEPCREPDLRMQAWFSFPRITQEDQGVRLCETPACPGVEGEGATVST